MRFRCSRCQTITEVTVFGNMTESFLASCSGCGLRHSLTLRRPRPSSVEQADQWAKDLARNYGIDVADAQSVIEGILTLDEAVEMFGAKARTPKQQAGERRVASPVAAEDAPAKQVSPAAPVSPRQVPASRPTVDLEISFDAPPSTPARRMPSTPPVIEPPTSPKTSAQGWLPHAAASRPGSETPTSLKAAAPSPVTQAPIHLPPFEFPASSAASSRELEFDPGFAQAVEDGCLTVQQAVERGNRQAGAARLAERHGLTTEVALNVVDNRLTVRQALMHKAEIERRETTRAARPATATISRGVRAFAVLSLVTLAAVGIATRYRERGKDPTRAGGRGSASRALPAVATSPTPAPTPSRASQPPAASEADFALVQTDTLGQIVRVEGPSARSVLAAYCAARGEAEKRQALDVVDALPPSASTRFGIFSVPSATGAPRRAIRIRREPNGRWSAGNGRGPITTEPAPETPDPARAQQPDADRETAVAAAPESPRR